MYEAYYGLREKPFAMAPDPAFLYMSSKHSRASALLEYGVRNQVGFTVITGAIGSGKTTLVRHMLKHHDQSVTVGLVSNTQCDSFAELLRWILLAFDQEYRDKDKVELYETLTGFLVDEHAANRQVVVIIDEAQHLGAGSLEQLRMLSNVNADKHQLLQLILVGQPELWNLLRRPELEQFAQRVGVDYYLEPLSEDESRDYVHHRLAVAGGNPDLFSDDGCELVARASGGIPRLINVICDTALVYGYADQAEVIDAPIVRDVLKDRKRSLAALEGDRRTEAPAGDPPELTDKVRQNG